MVQFRSINEYSHRNKIAPYIKICRPSVIFMIFVILIFVGPNPFWNKNFEIKILQLDVTTMNPGLKNVSICSQQENCQISLKIVSIRSEISS